VIPCAAFNNSHYIIEEMAFITRIYKTLQDPDSRLTWFTIISIPALVVSFIMSGGHEHGGSSAWSIQSLYDPAWIPILLCGFPIIKRAFTRLFTTGKIRVGLLISLAIISAVIVGELFAAGEVAFLLTLGQLLENRTLRKAREGLQKLVALAPRMANRLKDGHEEAIEADLLNVGDVVRIRPGETIPIDGVIISGQTSVDQAIVTGESIPVDKAPGDKILAGTVNLFGSMDARAEKTAEDTTLQRMIRLVKEAQERRAPVVRLADRWASVLVPTALLTAVIVGLATGETLRAVSILIVFCPCALALATPTAIMAVIANLSRHGILVKSGEALESMGRITTMAFDKTGTLTFGRPVVSGTFSDLPDFSDKELLRLVASAERHSEHPLGKAIAAAVPDSPEPTRFEMLPGKGISATVEGKQLNIGTTDWLADNGVVPSQKMQKNITAERETGKAVVAVEMDGRFAGLITLSDTLRPDASAMIKSLKKSGIRQTMLLTGDHPAAARHMATAAGVDIVDSELLPEDKVEHIKSYASQGTGIAMVGDGVNDAPALKTATVGIAMGGVGSDIAIEAADIVLMRDDIQLLPYLLRMSRRALNNITINITLSLLINASAITFAALGLLGPVLAALVHNASSLLVVSHASLLLRHKPGPGKPSR
jgi:heavy metal translocating P-type ATPase